MRTQINILSIIILIITGCFSNHNNKPKLKTYEKYISKDSLNIATIKLINDTLKAQFCFVAETGNRMDCCMEDSKWSIYVRKRDNIYIGEFKSCYTYENYPSKIILKDAVLEFYFTSTSYPSFLAKKILLYKRDNAIENKTK